MNWRKQLPKRAGMYWARHGADDQQPKVIQVVDNDGLQVIQLGTVGMLPLAEFASSQPTSLQVYGPMRIPKTPVPRREVVFEDSPDPVMERFGKQTDSAVVLRMLNDYLRQMPEESRRKIPRTLKLPPEIKSGEELQAAFERFDEATYTWGMENDVENPALYEVAHWLQAAWLQCEQIAMDLEPFEDPEDDAPHRKRG